MTDPKDANTESNQSNTNGNRESTTSSSSSSKIMSVGGYIFLAVSAFSFTVLTYDLWKTDIPHHTILDSKSPSFIQISLVFTSHLIQLASSLLTAMIGYALLRSAGDALKEVIPKKDSRLIYRLLLQNNDVGLKN